MPHGTLRIAALMTLVVCAPLCVAGQAVSDGVLVSKIDSLAEHHLGEGPVAGFAIGVVRGPELLLVRGYGFADVEQQVPVNAETVFRIGSLTKQFTAALIMKLVEEGRVALDEQIDTYIPGYDLAGREVTVRHLLTHTSGIKSYTGLGDEFWLEASYHDLTHDEMRALFEDEPFDFEPGAEYLYNNSGYYLLGMVIEAVTDMSFEAYLKTEILDPLGLTRTSYCHEPTIIPGRAAGYEQSNGALVNDRPISMNTPGAAGAMCSTVPDLLRWTSALRSGTVVEEASYRAMTTPAVLNDGTETGYGFGLGVVSAEAGRATRHTGGINGFSTVMSHDPDRDLDIVILSNTGSPAPGAMERAIAEWVSGGR